MTPAMRRSRHIPASFQARPVASSLLLLALFAAVAFAAWQVAAWAVYTRWAVDAARLETAPARRPVRSATLVFRYRGQIRFVAVPIDRHELAAARGLRTDTVFAQPPVLREAYLSALVRAQSRAPSVEALSARLRELRAEMGLDDDEYVELMAAAVQDMPYGRPEPAFALPVQTLAAGRGVCVDRSILLAALLLHEGYDAGLWAIPAHAHVGVAVRGVGIGYRDTGYAFIETTRRAYVGEVPDEFASCRPWDPQPLLVRAGGTLRYHADPQTAFLVAERRQAERAARELAPYRRWVDEAVGEWRRRYAAEAAKQATAEELVAVLDNHPDDRREAFDALERLNGWSEGPERAAP